MIVGEGLRICCKSSVSKSHNSRFRTKRNVLSSNTITVYWSAFEKLWQNLLRLCEKLDKWFVRDYMWTKQYINKQRRWKKHTNPVDSTKASGSDSRGKNVAVWSADLPAGGRVQAFGWLVAVGGFFLRGGLPPMRSEWCTLETVGDWGMLGRVRDLASSGLCSFLSSDLVG